MVTSHQLMHWDLYLTFNKMPVKDNKLSADSDAQYCSLEEAMDITINRYISDDNNEIGVSKLKIKQRE